VGYFLAVSSFRDSSVAHLAAAIQKYTSEFDVTCDLFDPGQAELDPCTDAIIFAPVGGWTVILWPEYFNIHDFPTCQALSRRLSTLVSTVHVYDGNYWAHGLFEAGETLDRFCSIPDYFAESSVAAGRMRMGWRGKPGSHRGDDGQPGRPVPGGAVAGP